ncbi:hypothetical protein CSB37_03500 [bacterium DOLZORAL124_38_8]|nr:MAG: hypothetical protein CSB37_03500 [bacterium DOLZORAL124_38_8]
MCEIKVLYLPSDEGRTDTSLTEIFKHKQKIKLEISKNIEAFFNKLEESTKGEKQVAYIDNVITLDDETKAFFIKTLGEDLVKKMQNGHKAGEVLAEFINTKYRIAVLLQKAFPDNNETFTNQNEIKIIHFPTKSHEIINEIVHLAQQNL